MKNIIIILAFAFFSTFSYAKSYYSVEGFLDFQQIDFDFENSPNQSLNLGVAGVAIGYNFSENTSLTYRIGTGVFNDDIESSDFETDLYTSLYLSTKYFISDPTYLFGGVGGGYTKINEISGGNTNITGLSLEIGVGYQFSKNWDVKLSWETIFNNNTYRNVDVDFSSANVTLAYNFW